MSFGQLRNEVVKWQEEGGKGWLEWFDDKNHPDYKNTSFLMSKCMSANHGSINKYTKIITESEKLIEVLEGLTTF